MLPLLPRSVTSSHVVVHSFAPVVHMMLFFGVGGYTMEYMCLGKYHVAHAKAEIEAALKHSASHH